MMLRLEMPDDAAAEYREQHDGADSHVQTVKTGQHEEAGTVGAGGEREIEFGVGMQILVRLQPQESVAQQDGQYQPDDELPAVVALQSPVRPSDGGAGRKQDQRVDGWNPP